MWENKQYNMKSNVKGDWNSHVDGHKRRLPVLVAMFIHERNNNTSMIHMND